MRKTVFALLAVILVSTLIFVGCKSTTTSTTTTTPKPLTTTSAPPTTTTTPVATFPSMTLQFNGGQFAATDVPGQTYNYFCNLVTQRTNGAVKFNYVGSNSLTKPGEEVTALTSGVVDVGGFSLVYYPTQLYVNSGFTRALPFDTTDYQAGYAHYIYAIL